MLHYHRGHPRIGQQSAHLTAGAVHPRPDLGLPPHHRGTALRGPYVKPRHLAIQLITLITRRHPRIQPITTGQWVSLFPQTDPLPTTLLLPRSATSSYESGAPPASRTARGAQPTMATTC